jgi:hypothetical protein
MTIAANDLLHGIAVGVGATIITDAWAFGLTRTFNVPAPNYCFVGRWLRHMPRGVFRHRSIAAAPQQPAECRVGWLAHYAIGVLFALILVLVASPQWLQAPTIGPAMLVGLATVAFPYLVMQPSFGLGIAASRTPNPTQARLRSLMTHAVFGLGLYLSAFALSAATAKT